MRKILISFILTFTGFSVISINASASSAVSNSTNHSSISLHAHDVPMTLSWLVGTPQLISQIPLVSPTASMCADLVISSIAPGCPNASYVQSSLIAAKYQLSNVNVCFSLPNSLTAGNASSMPTGNYGLWFVSSGIANLIQAKHGQAADGPQCLTSGVGTVFSTPGYLVAGGLYGNWLYSYTSGVASVSLWGLPIGTLVTAGLVPSSISVALTYTGAPADSVPGSPTSISTTPGISSIGVSWNAPSSNGGQVINGYTVAATGGATTLTCTTTSTSCTLNNAVPGISYSITVFATNGLGNSLSTTPVVSNALSTVPGAPTSIATFPGSSSIGVSWNAPSSNGGQVINGYTVAATGGATTLTCTTTSTSCTLNNAVPGISYSITVFATNGLGNSLSTTPVVSNAASSAPVWGNSDPSPIVVAGNGSLTVSWNSPSSNGGSPITNYIAAADINISNSPAYSCQATSLSCTITGLTNGTSYRVWVWAVNSVGRSGTSSSPVGVPLSSKPGAPTGVTATFQGELMVVSWLSPITDGGSPITSYTATISGGTNPIICQSTTLTCSASGTITGTNYSISVTATNAKGTSTSSSSISIGVPTAVPGAPTNVAVQPTGESTLTVNWQSPVFTGGAAISNYIATLTGNGAVFQCTTKSTSCQINGLTNGVTYNAAVIAVNSVGNSLQSTSASAVASSLPSAPSNVIANVVGQLLHISWNPSTSIGNSPIQRYSVSAISDYESLGCSGNFGYTSCDISGATPGTVYQIRVVAISSIGSTSSTGISAVIATPPAAPSAPRTSSTSNQITANWGPPSSNGGSEITSYVVTIKSNGSMISRKVDGQTLSCVFDNLQSSTGYEVSITALNSAGTSQSSISAFISTQPTPAASVNPKPVVITPTKKPTSITKYSSPSSGLAQFKAWELKIHSAINTLQTHFSIYSASVVKLGNKKVWTPQLVAMFNSDSKMISSLKPPSSSKNSEKVTSAVSSLSHALLSLTCYGTAMYGRSCNGLSGAEYLRGAASLVSSTFAYLRSTVNDSIGLEGCRSCIAI